MEERLEQHLDSIDISTFKINADAIRQAYDFKKKNDPAFKSMTQSRFATMIGIGESTWKKLLSKQATDAMCSTAWAIGKALGLDMSVIFGLAPMRDFDLEKREYNPTLMDNMRRQITALEERLIWRQEKIDELSAEIIKRDASEKELNSRYLEAQKELASERQKNADFPAIASELKNTKKHKHALAVCLFVSVVLTIAFASIMVYFLWELQNPNAGNWQF